MSIRQVWCNQISKRDGYPAKNFSGPKRCKYANATDRHITIIKEKMIYSETNTMWLLGSIQVLVVGGQCPFAIVFVLKGYYPPKLLYLHIAQGNVLT